MREQKCEIQRLRDKIEKDAEAVVDRDTEKRKDKVRL